MCPCWADLVEQYVVLRTGIPALTHPEALAQLRQTALEASTDADAAADAAVDVNATAGAAANANAAADVDAAADVPSESSDPESGSTLAEAKGPSQPLTVPDSPAAACVDQSPGQSAPAHPGAPGPSAEQPPTGRAALPHGSGNTTTPPAPGHDGEVSPEQAANAETAKGCCRSGEEVAEASTSNVAESQRGASGASPANLGVAPATARSDREEVDESRRNAAGGPSAKQGASLGVEAGQAADTGKGEKGDGAVFLLDVGVRSMMGGNTAAALSRLRRCEGILLEELEGAGAGAAVCSQLGAVCGLQARCRKA